MSIRTQEELRKDPNNKPLVIYHNNCPDGFAAAWAIDQRFGPVDLHPANYGEEPPYEKAKGKRVFVVDFSYPRSFLEALSVHADRLTLLDHHKTAEKDLEGLQEDLNLISPLDEIVFDMNRSGAGIAWDYAFPGSEKRPWLIDYVEDRDLWRFNLPYSKEVSLVIRTTPYTISAFSNLSVRDFQEIVQEGKGQLKYINHYCENVSQFAYNGRLAGYSCVYVNVTYTGISDVLHKLLEDNPDYPMACGYFYDGITQKVRVSLRSREPFDCSQVAQKFGGGGHPQASGFVAHAGDWYNKIYWDK